MGTWAARARRVVPGVTVAVLIGVTACASGDPPPAGSPSPSPTTSEPSSASSAVEVSPLTGLPGPAEPALAVKVDNTAPGWPQLGVADADLVYVVEVEGGLTRLLAVYASTLPPLVGPVRSARSSDVEILGGHGPIAFAFSGANSGVAAEVDQSPLQVVSSGEGYTRAEDRRAPYDLVVDPAVLLDRVDDPPVPVDIGFDFGDPPPGGRPATTASYAWPAATVEFSWDEAVAGWSQTMDGQVTTAPDGPAHVADTVVFQSVPVEPSGYVDQSGAESPRVVPVGDGPVTVLRDGRAWTGTWSRPAADRPTTLRADDGTALGLSPGTTWVVLIPPDAEPTVD